MKTHRAVSGLAVVLLLAACSQFAGERPGMTPTEVVKVVFPLATEGRYSEVEKYLTKACAKQVRAQPGGLMGWMNRDTREGTLVRIELVTEEIRGEGARVISIFWYKDGTKREDTTRLLKEHGRWRLSG